MRYRLMSSTEINKDLLNESVWADFDFDRLVKGRSLGNERA